MRQDNDKVRRILERIDRRSYKQYKELYGLEWKIMEETYRFLHIQGDPFAPPSILEIKGEIPSRQFPECRYATVALADVFLRKINEQTKQAGRDRSGEGKSGQIIVYKPGPIMIPRSSSIVKYKDGRYIFRILLRVGLPSRRRRILAEHAKRLLLQTVPSIISRAKQALNDGSAKEWCKLYIDQEIIRSQLMKQGFVSFIKDGSILPRKCGSCHEPLEGAVPFESPPSMRVEFETKYHGILSGMGLREGLTVIVGPAFHGKTTLLEAIRSGVWNHIPGDGREFVLTRSDAVYVKSENGRRVSCADLGNWLYSLPGEKDPSCFTTDDASGATSVAASFEEYISMGSRLVLVDEDETASNVLHRDYWTEDYTGRKTLVTFTELAYSMKKKGINLIIVASGTLPLLAVADNIIVMKDYKPIDASSFSREAEERARRAGLLHWEEYRIPRARWYVRRRLPRKWKITGLIYSDRLGESVRLDAFPYLEDPGQHYSSVKLAYTILKDKTLSSSRIEERIHRLLEASRDPGLVFVRRFEVFGVAERLPHFDKGLV